jgi:hypothetical protein
MTTTATAVKEPRGVPTAGRPAQVTVRQKATVLLSSAGAGVLGVLPHVLHHAGPLAGAALLAGTTGSLLFGAIGLVAAIPFLLRLHRRFGSWRIPEGVLAAMAVMFSISAFVIGPAINGDKGSSSTGSQNGAAPATSTTESGHASHH